MSQNRVSQTWIQHVRLVAAASRPRSQLQDDARYDAAKKSTGVAYLLLFLLGGLGVHRFYLGHWFTGLVLLLMIPLAFVSFGLSLAFSGLILFLDLFTIGRMVKQHKEKIIHRLTKESARIATQQHPSEGTALRIEPRL